MARRAGRLLPRLTHATHDSPLRPCRAISDNQTMDRQARGGIHDAHAMTNQSQNRKRVLIVDDDPLVSEALAEFIRHFRHPHAYDILRAKDGADALFQVLLAKPDLVLLDLAMPEMGGLELLKQLKALDIKVRAIVITGALDLEESAKALAQDIIAYVPKPINFDYLEHLVALALGVRS